MILAMVDNVIDAMVQVILINTFTYPNSHLNLV